MEGLSGEKARELLGFRSKSKMTTILAPAYEFITHLRMKDISKQGSYIVRGMLEHKFQGPIKKGTSDESMDECCADQCVVIYMTKDRNSMTNRTASTQSLSK